MAHQNFADAAALNELLRRVAVRVVTQLKPDLEQVLGVLGRGDHGAALLGRDGQRLFRIQMLADFEDRDVYTSAIEMKKSQCGDHFKKRGRA